MWSDDTARLWARALEEPGRGVVGQTAFPLEVTATPLMIGRDERAALRILDRRVSRQHAAIVLRPDGRVCVVDLGSDNGTYVNRRAIPAREHVVLHSGVVLSIGHAFRIEILEIESHARDPGPFRDDEVTLEEAPAGLRERTSTSEPWNDYPDGPFTVSDFGRPKPSVDVPPADQGEDMAIQKILQTHVAIAPSEQWEEQRKWDQALDRAFEIYRQKLDSLLQVYRGRGMYVAIQGERLEVGPDRDALLAKFDVARPYFVAPIEPVDVG